ncbi:hypothetical protein C7U60_02705 [Mesorhizobium plurifarium]|uniref:hypothetical protein n=1 Tax=Sinorhizobium arboris TaxID=76745 RepID=UPI000424A283|nr:hypothetical protein [Sinorhizobium arboris]PST27212.1 hypothetical protein C7U60_02705 [Mesorhizobium plurifarium]
MVTIPTSRDVAYASSRSGRIAPSGPSVSVGAAVADAGQALTHVAYNLNDLRTQEALDNQNKAGFDLETKIAQFRDQEEQSFNKAREEASESGIGFTRSFMEGYEKRANDFVKANFANISEGQNAQSRQTLLGLGNSLYGKSHAYEQQSKTNFYDRTTNGNLDKIRTQIGNNAAPFDQLKKQGLEAINSADMPEAWKAERRALWDSDAAESKWRWKFQQDPDTAVRQMKGITVDAKGLSNAIQQTAEQLGVNPVDLATVMSYETGGTFDPWKKGPTTKWGEHRGLIQWGEPQRAKYGVTADMPIEQQVAAVGRYLRDAGVQPGMGLLDIYSAVNAGAPGLYDRSDYKQGGAPGTVADKVKYQMEQHKAKAAALLGGTYTPAANDPDLDAIPYERRAQLASWGETEYSQQITKQRAAAKDSYSLLIATQPEQVRESVILQDPALDTGDKAQLITSLRSALKESAGVNQFIGSLAQGNVDVNPFNADQVKVADKGYEKLLSVAASPEEQKAVTSDFVARTGYIPKTVQAELRNGASSTDPAVVAQSMEAGLVLSKNAPVSFGAFEGSAGVRSKMDVYRAYTRDMGYSPEEAGRKLVDANDPEKASQREALLKSKTVADALKAVSADTIASSFDTSRLGLAPNPSLGPNPAAEAAMLAEYRSIYQEAIVEAGGDMTAAKLAADERFKRSYGVTGFSTMGNNVVVKNPPEKAYPPAPDGTFDYIREQLAETMKGQGVEAEEFFLHPDEMTARDIRAGLPPRYVVLYRKDGKLERFNVPFYADTIEMKKRYEEKKANSIRQSEGRMIENRERSIRERDAAENAFDQTVGPDWMKARAAEQERERVRQDETLRDLRGFNPGPINGGGGGGY